MRLIASGMIKGGMALEIGQGGIGRRANRSGHHGHGRVSHPLQGPIPRRLPGPTVRARERPSIRGNPNRIGGEDPT